MSMNPTEVHCARCLAVPGEPCTTLYSKRAVSPHKPRVEVARAGVGCEICDVRPFEPCVDHNGRVRMFMHRSRLRALVKATRNGVA